MQNVLQLGVREKSYNHVHNSLRVYVTIIQCVTQALVIRELYHISSKKRLGTTAATDTKLS